MDNWILDSAGERVQQQAVFKKRKKERKLTEKKEKEEVKENISWWNYFFLRNTKFFRLFQVYIYQFYTSETRTQTYTQQITPILCSPLTKLK